MGEQDIEWRQKNLPMSQIIISLTLTGFIILIFFFHLLCFIILSPLLSISIFYLFLNKNNYSIEITDELFIIKPRLLLPRRRYRLKELSSILISFNKRKDTYNVGSDGNRSYTSIIYYSIELKSIYGTDTWKFKQKHKKHGKGTKTCMKGAIIKRKGFEKKIIELKYEVPDLIIIQDNAPESKILNKSPYCMSGFCLFTILMTILMGGSQMIETIFVLAFLFLCCLLFPSRKTNYLNDKRKEIVDYIE